MYTGKKENICKKLSIKKINKILLGTDHMNINIRKKLKEGKANIYTLYILKLHVFMSFYICRCTKRRFQ